MTSKNSINSVQFSSILYYFRAGTAATRPLQRHHRNVIKYMNISNKWKQIEMG
jgi:hypothetical protein